jgi:diguanylate cyclase (GGDEF)-like protein
MKRSYPILFICLLLATLCGRAAPVLHLDAARDAVTPAGQLEVLEDRSGRMTLADAMTQHFLPLPGSGLSAGYRRSAYWLRLTVNAAPGAAGPWLVEIRFPPLGRIDAWLPASGQSWQMGNRLPFAARPVPHRNFVLPLMLQAGATQTLYLRVESEGSLVVPLRLWPQQAFWQHSASNYALQALYYGALLALALYNLLLFLSLRDRNYLAYVAFSLSMIVGQLAESGLGKQYLWPNWLAWGDIAYCSGFAAAGLFGGIFTRSFLATRRTAPRLDLALRALLGAFAVAMLGSLVLPYRWCAMLLAVAGALSALLAVLVGIQSVRRKQPGAGYFLGAWALLLIGVGLMSLRNLGLLPDNLFTANALQMGSALEMLLLSFALADRIQTARQEKEQAQADALASKEQLLFTLRRSEQMLEQHVSERTRELARANARLIASENKLSHMAHHDPLTGLANRLLLHERLNNALLMARREGRQVAVLVIDLDGFKPVNDTYGHETGDRLLVEVASQLREVVRSSDTVARMGGDEFVVVLTPLAGPDMLNTLADRLAEAVKQANRRIHPAAQVSASIGIALYPEHGDTIHSLLHKADQAMYAAKSQGRDRWHLLQEA